MNPVERLYWKFRFLRTAARGLNRRVDVENVLLDVATGKREVLTPGECRKLAEKLGATT